MRAEMSDGEEAVAVKLVEIREIREGGCLTVVERRWW